jgi:hypothetical protein
MHVYMTFLIENYIRYKLPKLRHYIMNHPVHVCGGEGLSNTSMKVCHHQIVHRSKLTKHRGRSPQANYTDRATAAYWRSLVHRSLCLNHKITRFYFKLMMRTRSPYQRSPHRTFVPYRSQFKVWCTLKDILDGLSSELPLCGHNFRTDMP